MTASVGDIVAQLRDARERLANAAVTAMRAKADADEACARFTEAARGTAHPRIQRAITESRTAGEKSAKFARLLEKANGHLANYSNRIAPGSGSNDDASKALPSGDELMQTATERVDSRRRMASFLGKMSRNIENLQEAGKNATEVAQNTIKVIRNPFGPRGSQSASTSTPPTLQPTPAPQIKATEAAGHLLAATLIAGVAIHRSSQLIARQIERLRKGADEKRAE